MADNDTRRSGLLFAIGAYLSWGVLPLYFKAVAAVAPGEILAHRVLWSLLFLAAVVLLWRRWRTVRAALANRRAMAILAATALLIGANWLVYIYAVVSGHVLEGSLGYYLNPLVNVLLGVVLLKERLSPLQMAATALAGAGVALLAFGAGSGLWISLALAATFSLYGLLRKIAPVDALEGLWVETALLAPLALGWLLWVQGQGGPVFLSYGTTVDLLLVAGGMITAIPLLLFTAAARRLPYSTMGFLQYISPTLQFLLAVVAFGEPLTPTHMVCFAAIWSALALVTFDGVRGARARRLQPA
jgi:chloramphenicol-sensitive protein RarD